MKRSNVMIMIFGCICLLLSSVTIARAEDAATTANQAASELRKSRVITRGEAAAIEAPLKDMAEKGASKEELKSVVTELSNKRVRGADLKQSVNSMRDLVNEGESLKEAGSVVSQAAAQAHQQGLKGKDLAAKVHEAIQQRKAQQEEDKKQEQLRIRIEEEKRIQKQEQERVRKEEQEKAQKQEQERIQKEEHERIQKQEQERAQKEEHERIQKQGQEKIQKMQNETQQKGTLKGKGK